MRTPPDAPLFPIVDGKYKMDREPKVRIGVVLEEDAKASVEFQVRANGFTLVADGRRAPLAAGAALTATAGPGAVVIRDAQGGEVARGAVVRVEPPAAGEPVGIGEGTLVRGIVAGRVFHWRKLIDQTLTGALEFLPRGAHLIMVNELPMEEYLTGVITGEMSGDCPIEYMKAQAVAARSWLLGQPRSPHPGEPFHWCNDDHCQRYQGTGGWSQRAIDAIAACRGEVLITASGRYCDARYSKNTGGISEDGDFIWGEKIEGLKSRPDVPESEDLGRFARLDESNIREYLLGDWLQSTRAWGSPNVVSSAEVMPYLGRVDEAGDYFRWTWNLQQEALVASLRRFPEFADAAEVTHLVPGPRGKGGRQLWLTVEFLDNKGARRTQRIERDYNIRARLDPRFLFSSCFVVDRVLTPKGAVAEFTLHGGGWGHGAGLCQMGGLARALHGQNHATILLHYYSDVRLERIYD
jgi:SpoIID/LytB domain protein